MADIRRKGIITTSIIYVGFLIGAINNLLLTKQGFFTTEEYGLTKSLIDLGILFSAFAALGSNTLIIKFFPYHNRHTSQKQNDLLSITFFIATIGLIVTCLSAYICKFYIIQKLGTNAPMLVTYFYWAFLITAGVLYYGLLEVYSWFFNHQILTNLLRETILRAYTILVILAKILGFISFDTFMVLYCIQYIVIAVIIFTYLYKKGQINFTFTISKVSKRYKKHMIALVIYGFSFVLVTTLKNGIDSLMLNGLLQDGLRLAGIYTFAQFSSSLIQAPLRSIASLSIPILSNAWREKNIKEIERLYKRSAINLLMASLFIYGIILLNYKDAIQFFGLNKDIEDGFIVFVILGLNMVIDGGTGINGQIIGTSTRWRFEFYTNVLLCIIMIPASYILTKTYGIIGPALGTLFAVIIYNAIRIWFLYNWYNMHPFSVKSIYVIILTIIVFLVCYYIFPQQASFINLSLRTIVFTVVFMSIAIWLRVSPDMIPVINTVLKKIGIKFTISE